MAVLLAGCTLTAGPGSIYSGSMIKLKYADQNAPAGWEGAQAAQPWLDQITAATNGRVQFETYYSENLVKGADAWTATRLGLVDIAWMFHGYWADLTPLSDVISLPLLPFTSAKQASGILWQLYEKYPSIRAEFRDNHVLLVWASTPYFLVTANRQVKTLDDIKGLRVRVPDGPPVEIIKALGAIPVLVGMPDIYLYLQKGVIDGMTTSWESLLSFRHYELVNYYTYIPLFTVYFSQAVNIDVWNSLPPDIKEQINSVSGLQGSLFWGENMFDTAAAAGREQVKQLGLPMKEYTLSEEELARWSKVAQPLWDEWIKKMTDSGRPEAQEILDTTLELIENYQP